MGFDRVSASLYLALTLLCSSEPSRAALPLSTQATILHHKITAELLPDTHELIVSDEMTVRLRHQQAPLTFSLAPSLQVERVSLKDKSRSDEGMTDLLLTEQTGSSAQEGRGRVEVRLPQGTNEETVMLSWRYRGTIHDPPREPRHLRFVTPSETSGHIGPEGVYLSSESQWYPDIAGSLATYELAAKVPEGWAAVTQGREIAGARWSIETKSEALTLVANRFVVKMRDWQAKTGQRIQLVTYLFPEDAHLAEEYLDASAKYLDTYIPLLGPYPFSKFAVVENFFASGLGMPSFTLLGSSVIKRHYTQPYALGHEIVHSWIGNWVLNDLHQGNWVEGLTTFLANYYYEELTGTTEQAREQRRMMLLGYAVYVRPEEDYPVAQFRQKTDQKDNAIGYQKAAMIFHMLRGEIGEEAFWKGIKAVVDRHGGAYATWRDLETVFAATASRDLRWFFAQWVERSGALGLRITDRTEVLSAQESKLALRILQDGDVYRIHLPIVVKIAGGESKKIVTEVTSADQEVTLTAPGRPVSLQIDPDFESFRRLARGRLSPMLNLFVTDKERTVVLPSSGTAAERQPYQELAKQIMSRERGIAQVSDREASVVVGSMLVLGGPGVNEAAEWAAVRACGGKVNLQRDSVTIEGRSFVGPSTALLVSCRHPERPEHVVTLFYGLTPAAAAKVARLLFFYGWQSYVVFEEGRVVSRGDFLDQENPLKVQFHEP